MIELITSIRIQIITFLLIVIIIMGYFLGDMNNVIEWHKERNYKQSLEITQLNQEMVNCRDKLWTSELEQSID